MVSSVKPTVIISTPARQPSYFLLENEGRNHSPTLEGSTFELSEEVKYLGITLESRSKTKFEQTSLKDYNCVPPTYW